MARRRAAPRRAAHAPGRLGFRRRLRRARRAQLALAARLQNWYFANRPADAVRRAAPQTRPAGKLYFGGLGASESSLSYLDGTLPGDYGCGATLPLGLGVACR